MAAAFGAADRLHRRSEFLRVQRQGMRLQTAHFVLYGARFPDSKTSRLGITVSHRIGNAVVRNRIKRRIRECYRLMMRPKLGSGVMLVIIARSGAGALRMNQLAAEVVDAAVRLGARMEQ